MIKIKFSAYFIKNCLRTLRPIVLVVIIFSYAGDSKSQSNVKIIGVTAQEVTVSQEKLISSNIPYALNEPHLIINPKDPNHLLVAAIFTKEWLEGQLPSSYIVLLQSLNGGDTWEEKHFNENVALGADPWLSMNKKGTLILTALIKFKNSSTTNLITYVSKDEGKTWEEDYLDLGFAHDRQSVVVDHKTDNFIMASAKRNRNLEEKNLWGLMITRLASDGSLREANWHALSNIDKNNGVPLLLPEGTLIVPFMDYMVGNKMLDTRRTWLIKSSDFGRTFSEPLLIIEGGKFPHLVLDTSNTARPKLHFLKRKGAFREYLGYKIITSDNLGYSWGVELEVDMFEGNNPHIRGGQPIVNQEGKLAVFWYDNRNAPEGGHNLFFNYSGKETEGFKQPVKISSATSFPNPEKNGMVDKRWPVGGDYFGLATTPDGNFRVVWVDYRNGPPQLYHALVEIRDKTHPGTTD